MKAEVERPEIGIIKQGVRIIAENDEEGELLRKIWAIAGPPVAIGHINEFIYIVIAPVPEEALG